MKRSDAFPSNYLGKEDVPRPFVATIKSVAMGEIKGDGGVENKPIMHFAGDTKPMIVNNINWIQCEAEYGPDSDGWTGKPVEIFVDPNVMFGNKRVGGVRLRIPAHSSTGPDPAIMAIMNTAAKNGLTALEQAWKMLTKPQKQSVLPLLPKLKADALARGTQGDANEDDSFQGGPEPTYDDPEPTF